MLKASVESHALSHRSLAAMSFAAWAGHVVLCRWAARAGRFARAWADVAIY